MWAGSWNYDEGGECFITDIAQELNAGFEGSPLLEDSLFDYEEKALTNESVIKTEMSSGSGSETSSIETRWSNKTDLDTPPTTPPLGCTAENICVIASNNVTLFPYSLKRGTQAKPKVKTIAAKESNNDNGTVNLPRSALTKEEFQKQQAQRRKERMIRNRESAYLSRKRAKEHVNLLESQVQLLTEENHRLKEENIELRERLGKYEKGIKTTQWRRIPDLPKKTTVLLVLAVTFCFNIHTFSLLDNGVNKDDMTLATDPVAHHTRSLLWMQSLDENVLSNLSCPVAINQSESLRLERELREWIVGGGESNPLPVRIFTPQPQVNSSGRRRKRIPRLRRARHFPLDVWGLNPSMLGLEGLYEAIHRRDDTFYLVSFSADHLLLPAMASNATSRPKMSFMVPAFLTNSSTGERGQVEMMQIDCEVTNTQLLSVRDDDIPSRLRNGRKFTNDSVKTPADKEYSENYLINLESRNKTVPQKNETTENYLPTKSPMFWLKLNQNNSNHWQTSLN